MKFRKLLEKAQALFNPEARKTKAKKKNLKHVIKELRKHEKNLQARLNTEPSESKAAKLTDQINLAHAQRKKGLRVLKTLKKK